MPVTDKVLINELKLIMAHSQAVTERCKKLLDNLDGTDKKKKKDLDAKTRANLIAKARKTMYKA